MYRVVSRIVSYSFGVAFTLAATSMIVGIVVLAANDRSAPADYGSGPGMALVMILQR